MDNTINLNNIEIRMMEQLCWTPVSSQIYKETMMTRNPEPKMDISPKSNNVTPQEPVFDCFQAQLHQAGLLKPAVDINLYSKLMQIDPSAARTFIQTRLDNLKAQIEPLNDEIRQLNKIISYDKNKEIQSYYEKTHKIKKTYGISAAINAFFVDNIGKEFRASQVYDHLRSSGQKVDDQNQVCVTLARLRKLGQLASPYRGVYKMENKYD